MRLKFFSHRRDSGPRLRLSTWRFNVLGTSIHGARLIGDAGSSPTSAEA
jgi:hypothetical protein